MPPSLFPRSTITDTMAIPNVIAKQNAGKPMRRLEVFHALKKAPDSGPSRMLVTASSSYELTKGGYTAEFLELADIGKRAAVEGDRSALLDAVLKIDIFRLFFERYVNAQFPADVTAKSFLADNKIPTKLTDECLAVIRANGKKVGLIQALSGAERIVSVEFARAELSGKSPTVPVQGVAEKPDGLVDGGLVQEKLKAGTLPSLNINLEIHLPPDADAGTYDAIFKGIREHLIDVGNKK